MSSSAQTGRTYVIDSTSPLEVGGAVCTHPEAVENRTALRGDLDRAASKSMPAAATTRSIISPKIPIPVTLRGGPGDDRLYGGPAPTSWSGARAKTH